MRTDQELKDQLLALGMPSSIVEDFTNACGWYNDFRKVMSGEIAVVLMKNVHQIDRSSALSIREQNLEWKKQWTITDITDEIDVKFGACISGYQSNNRLFVVDVHKLNRNSNLIEAIWEVPNENAN